MKRLIKMLIIILLTMTITNISYGAGLNFLQGNTELVKHCEAEIRFYEDSSHAGLYIAQIKLDGKVIASVPPVIGDGEVTQDEKILNELKKYGYQGTYKINYDDNKIPNSVPANWDRYMTVVMSNTNPNKDVHMADSPGESYYVDIKENGQSIKQYSGTNKEKVMSDVNKFLDSNFDGYTVLSLPYVLADQLEKVEDINAIRYMKAGRCPVYKGTISGGLFSLDSVADGNGYSVYVEAKYKDTSGKLWAKITKIDGRDCGNDKFVLASNLSETKPSQEDVDGSKGTTETGEPLAPDAAQSAQQGIDFKENLTGPSFVSFGGEGEGTAIVNPITDTADTYKPENFGDASEAVEIGITIIKAIRTIGVVFSVIAIMIYGIRYMFGSLEEKAEYKETFMPWIIGSLLLTTGTVIVQYIYTIASGI